MAIKCKRIIDGKTYNTETATRLEGWEEFHGNGEYGEVLYQTRFGAFFLFSYDDHHGAVNDKDAITPYSSDQAREWLEKHHSHRVDLIEKLFGEMPEAGSGETKFTLRMPDSLRDRLAEHAKNSNQSLNAWIVKCLETCASPPPDSNQEQPKRRMRLL